MILIFNFALNFFYHEDHEGLEENNYNYLSADFADYAD